MYQKIILIANLGGDPVMRYTANGQAMANFSVATNNVYTKDGERVKETTWWRVFAFGKLAETVNQYLHKGSKVYLECRMNQDKSTGGPRIWTKKNGSPASNYEVVAQLVKFLDSKGDNNPVTQAQQPSAMMPPEDDDMPF